MSCDDGDQYVLIQRHIEPPMTASFNRSWAEFRDGFCDSWGNFWIGNKKLWQATSQQDPARSQLRVVLTSKDGTVSVFPNNLILLSSFCVTRTAYLSRPHIDHRLIRRIICQMFVSISQMFRLISRHGIQSAKPKFHSIQSIQSPSQTRCFNLNMSRLKKWLCDQDSFVEFIKDPTYEPSVTEIISSFFCLIFSCCGV